MPPEERRELLGTERARSPRPWIAWAALAVLTAAAVITVQRGQDDSSPSPRPPSPPPSTQAAVSGPPWGMVPPARAADGRTSLHLVFPDGSTAEISYPASLDLARLGVRPQTAGWLAGPYKGCCVRSLFAPPTGDAWFASGGPPTGRLDGADGGSVAIVPPPAAGPQSPYLVFTFGRWRLGLQNDRYDHLDGGRAAAWAGNLHGRVTPDGFLVLRATGPLRLARPVDERGTAPLGAPAPFGGPQLRFGRGLMAALTIGAYDDPVVVFEPVSRCRASTDLTRYLGLAVSDAACKGSSMRVWAGGDEQFVRAVLRDVRVSQVRLAMG